MGPKAFLNFTQLTLICFTRVRVAQCLTAEIGPPPASAPNMDIFAGALADGGAAVLFYNRGSSALPMIDDLSVVSSDIIYISSDDIYIERELCAYR